MSNESYNRTIIGYVGGVLLNITFMPQIYKIYKTKQTQDISLTFAILQVITCIFCLTYSIMLDENPLIISNSILLFQLIILLFGKILYSYVYKKKIITNQNNQDNQDIVLQNQNENNLAVKKASIV